MIYDQTLVTELLQSKSVMLQAGPLRLVMLVPEHNEKLHVMQQHFIDNNKTV